MSLRQPVQYPVRYYSHLDAGAPQLADADGNIKTIIKACLVTGIGAKEGAGWQSLFEDDFRIVLRRPLRTGNPPDIKIENGVINGAASHRIVSQDNPTGLNDATKLAAVNLLTRGNNGNEWHLAVTDFAFMLCYQCDGTTRSDDKNNILYCGSVKKMQDSSLEVFTVNFVNGAKINGTGDAYAYDFFADKFIDMRTGLDITDLRRLRFNVSELAYNNEYTAQNLFLNNNNMLPFYTSLGMYDSLVSSIIDIDARQMLRYAPAKYRSASAAGSAALYIPLDYWEL